MSNATPKMKTPAQHRALFAKVGELRRLGGLSADDAEEVLRQHCEAVSGKRSTSALTEQGAREVLQRLSAEVAAYTPAPAPPRPDQTGNAIFLLTAAQRTTLEGLCAQAKLPVAGFCQRQLGRDLPRTNAEFDKVVHALQDIVLRRVDVATVLARVAALRGDARLDSWKAGFIEDLHAQLVAKGAKALTTHKLAKLDEAERWVARRG